MPAGIVDAHFHVWDTRRFCHGWLEAAPASLRRTFDIDDFTAASAQSDVSAAVVVQALASTSETQHLLAESQTSSIVAGVVGWVDLTADDVGSALGVLRSGPGGERLVGIRHLAQDEADPQWLERPDVIKGLRAVAQAGLVYDILVRSRELPSAIVAVDAVGSGRFVLDHGGKPDIMAGEGQPWRALVRELARRPQVACKVSGLVTEAGQSWTAEAIAPYLDHLLSAFGPSRLVFGTDWPVCTPVARYEDVVGMTRSLLDEQLAGTEVEQVMAGNALELYRLSTRSS